MSYTGKTIELVNGPDGMEVQVRQKDFIRGRLESMKLERRGRSIDELATAMEASEFKSMCGSLCWLAGRRVPTSPRRRTCFKRGREHHDTGIARGQ